LTLCVFGALIFKILIVKNNLDYKLSVGEGVDINVPPGSSTGKIAEILEQNNLVNYPRLFKLISRLNKFDGLYKSGTHTISSNMTYQQMMKKLTENPNIYHITIPEGFNSKQIINLFANKKAVNLEKIEELINKGNFQYKFLQKVPMRKNRLEGYMFPDTYQIGLNEKPDEIIKKMLQNFDNKFKPEFYKRAEKMNYSVDQIIIMASIVEREAYFKREMKTIAGVFYNRLKSKSKPLKRLQTDASIQYIYFMQGGSFKDKLYEKDTKINHLYNTYIYEGLPPGPLCSPGINAIEAALFPETHQFYYFVAKPDKSNAFSKTYDEHKKNVKKYGGY
jgi:UPF0755 protein